MVKTKCLFDPVEDRDGTRLVIAYKLPSKSYLSQFNAEWELDVAPTPVIVRAYKRSNITWKEYTNLYLAEMKAPRAVEAINKWAKFAAGGKVLTLLCYEKEENPHCHRHLLKKLIDKQVTCYHLDNALIENPDDGHTSLGEEQAMKQFGVPPL